MYTKLIIYLHLAMWICFESCSISYSRGFMFCRASFRISINSRDCFAFWEVKKL